MTGPQLQRGLGRHVLASALEQKASALEEACSKEQQVSLERQLCDFELVFTPLMDHISHTALVMNRC